MKRFTVGKKGENCRMYTSYLSFTLLSICTRNTLHSNWQIQIVCFSQEFEQILHDRRIGKISPSDEETLTQFT